MPGAWWRGLRSPTRPTGAAAAISRPGSSSRGIAAITGVDTRRITRILREGGAQNAALAYLPDTELDLDDLKARARACPSLEGMDLAAEVSGPPALRLGREPLAVG